jgi:hypothetical protein
MLFISLIATPAAILIRIENPAQRGEVGQAILF